MVELNNLMAFSVDKNAAGRTPLNAEKILSGPRRTEGFLSKFRKDILGWVRKKPTEVLKESDEETQKAAEIAESDIKKEKEQLKKKISQLWERFNALKAHYEKMKQVPGTPFEMSPAVADKMSQMRLVLSKLELKASHFDKIARDIKDKKIILLAEKKVRVELAGMELESEMKVLEPGLEQVRKDKTELNGILFGYEDQLKQTFAEIGDLETALFSKDFDTAHVDEYESKIQQAKGRIFELRHAIADAQRQVKTMVGKANELEAKYFVMKRQADDLKAYGDRLQTPDAVKVPPESPLHQFRNAIKGVHTIDELTPVLKQYGGLPLLTSTGKPISVEDFTEALIRHMARGRLFGEGVSFSNVPELIIKVNALLQTHYEMQRTKTIENFNGELKTVGDDEAKLKKLLDKYKAMKLVASDGGFLTIDSLRSLISDLETSKTNMILTWPEAPTLAATINKVLESKRKREQDADTQQLAEQFMDYVEPGEGEEVVRYQTERLLEKYKDKKIPTYDWAELWNQVLEAAQIKWHKISTFGMSGGDLTELPQTAEQFEDFLKVIHYTGNEPRLQEDFLKFLKYLDSKNFDFEVFKEHGKQ